LPYNSALIFFYDDFCLPLRARQTRKRNWPMTLFLTARVSFWTLFNEAVLHLTYFNAIFLDVDLLESVSNSAWLGAIAYLSGQ